MKFHAFAEKPVTLMVLLEESHVTFDLIDRLYERFQQGVLSVHQQSSRPTPRQVSHAHIP